MKMKKPVAKYIKQKKIAFPLQSHNQFMNLLKKKLKVEEENKLLPFCRTHNLCIQIVASSLLFCIDDDDDDDDGLVKGLRIFVDNNNDVELVKVVWATLDSPRSSLLLLFLFVIFAKKNSGKILNVSHKARSNCSNDDYSNTTTMECDIE
ncbi:hypothetical protein DERF_007339 [Dermatophagoides farinae]|uniref:Uncharacterized protein n=1 Tax=Dermatophagoides farinae TaxID=6954 RepID=A0A922I145_DERFA|nr:hypothetical protein DERF_007339 [Dermatophagoides farinae]